MRGKVIKFSDKLGYGFIKAKEYEKDIFVHYSAIRQKGYKTLSRGELVDFDFDKDAVKALNVRKVGRGHNIIRKSYTIRGD